MKDVWRFRPCWVSCFCFIGSHSLVRVFWFSSLQKERPKHKLGFRVPSDCYSNHQRSSCLLAILAFAILCEVVIIHL